MPDTISADALQMALASHSPTSQLVGECSSSINMMHLFLGHTAHSSTSVASGKSGVMKFPPHLVGLFAIGIIVFFTGLAGLLLSVLVDTDAVRLVSAALVTIGSITVVLTLLRGQDIAEHIH